MYTVSSAVLDYSCFEVFLLCCMQTDRLAENTIKGHWMHFSHFPDYSEIVTINNDFNCFVFSKLVLVALYKITVQKIEKFHGFCKEVMALFLFTMSWNSTAVPKSWFNQILHCFQLEYVNLIQKEAFGKAAAFTSIYQIASNVLQM